MDFEYVYVAFSIPSQGTLSKTWTALSGQPLQGVSVCPGTSLSSCTDCRGFRAPVTSLKFGGPKIRSNYRQSQWHVLVCRYGRAPVNPRVCTWQCSLPAGSFRMLSLSCNIPLELCGINVSQRGNFLDHHRVGKPSRTGAKNKFFFRGGKSYPEGTAAELSSNSASNRNFEDRRDSSNLVTALGAFPNPDYLLAQDFDFIFPAGCLVWAAAHWFGWSERGRTFDWIAARIQALLPKDADGGSDLAKIASYAGAVPMVLGLGVSTYVGVEEILGEGWPLSTGILALVTAGVYEIARPKRLSQEEAEVEERLWNDFELFATKRIEPCTTGSVHFVEIVRAFRLEYGRYRTEEQLPDLRIQRLLRKYYPKVQRTRAGYYRGLSLQSRASPFGN